MKIAVFVVDLRRIMGYHGNRKQEVVFMALQPQMFDPRQEMGRLDFELQYKRDSYLKDVELHHHDFFELYFLPMLEQMLDNI